MAEQFESFKRFEYRTNSNLVLQRDGPGPSHSEATGEPESLVGRLKYKMGDRVAREHPKVQSEKRSNVHAKPRGKGGSKKIRLDLDLSDTVLNVDISDSLNYIPTSVFTRRKYEEILNLLQRCLGDQPHEVIRGACDELLVCLKTPNVNPQLRRSQCQEIIGQIDDDTYYKLYHAAKDLNDYNIGKEDELDGDNDADPAGVAVVFDEDEDAEDEEDKGENDDDDEYDNVVDDVAADLTRKQIRREHLNGDLYPGESSVDERYYLPVAKIDPHWLQRELNLIFNDANVAVDVEKEILDALAIEDVQECENRLVCILKYENFDFLKLILNNRHKIVYCTRLGQAQTPADRETIIKEMQESVNGQQVLEELESVNLRGSKTASHLMESMVQKPNDALSHHIEQEVDDETTLETLNSVDAPTEGRLSASSNIKFVDLETLAFKDGSHHMTNTKVILPKDTERVEYAAYDEVIIKPLDRPKNVQRRKIAELPEWMHAAFPGIDSLNPVQSAVSNVALEHSEENMLICAPTGAGKTNVAVLAMLSVMAHHYNESTGLDLDGFKIVYVSPMKSLVMEQAQAFSLRFAGYGMKVKELTGDMHLTRRQLMETQLIVTTPEKWDVVTRRPGMETALELLIFDEIHLLHDKRGPVLEALVARTMHNNRTCGLKTRLVGLSATLPNYEDIAEFLHVNPKVGLFYFGNHYRPVGLEQRYIGIKERKAIKRFNVVNDIVYERVIAEAGVNQMLVFVHSRRETARTAKLIRDTALTNERLDAFLHKESASREILATEAEHIKTLELRELLPFGFGIHHAGLPRSDRKLVEDLFADGHIQLLVSTATLSWGVNLPAHTVIIKGTQVYSPEDGCWTELCPLSVQQMMGRAGRPQYDTQGQGIIITSIDRLQFYLSLNNQQLPIESQLIANTPELLNAEVVLGNIDNLKDAVKWLEDTYLAVRSRKNPVLYGVLTEEEFDEYKQSWEKHDQNVETNGNDATSATDVPILDPRIHHSYLETVAHSALETLNRLGLVRYERKGGAIQSTAMGRIASVFYLRPGSVRAYLDNLRPGMSDSDLLRIFAASSEFKYIPVRHEEIVELKNLMERVPIPVRGQATEPGTKVVILLQSYISRFPLDGYALNSEMSFITQNAARICRALFEICLKRNWSSAAQRLHELCKMVEQRMWSVMIPLRQFKTLPEELVLRLERNDFGWERYYDLSSVELGELCRLPKLGKTLHRLVHLVPKLDLEVFVQPLTRHLLCIEVLVSPSFEWDPKLHGHTQRFWLMLEDDSGEELLHSQIVCINQCNSVGGATAAGGESGLSLWFTAPILEPPSSHYFLRISSENWIANPQKVSISFDRLILPQESDAHCQILDLQPLPVASLTKLSGDLLKISPKLAAQLFHVDTFGPVVTQVFPAIVRNSESLYISAPARAGKFTCAELAILQTLATCENATIIVVTPFESRVEGRFSRLSTRFSKLCSVAKLTGELQDDLAAVNNASIIVGSPEHWQVVSRRWKTRRALQTVDLYVVEGLDLLGDGHVGPDLEVVTSRFRFISAQLGHATRVIGTSAPIANAVDVSQWLGVARSGIFNFGPNTRQVPLVVSLQTYDQLEVECRHVAMFKAAAKLIRKHLDQIQDESGSKVIAFTADRRYCRLLALELHARLAGADANQSSDSLRQYVGNGLDSLLSRERALETLLNDGVGYCHEGFSSFETLKMQQLLEENRINVLVATSSLCWTLDVSCKMSIVLDVSCEASNRPLYHKIYPQSDICRMVNFACIPGINGCASAVVMLQVHLREHYKRLLNEAMPVDSALESKLEDLFNVEIVQGAITNAQDAIDWLTWTLYYRRLPSNPNFYSLSGATSRHMSEHLSELVENTTSSLEKMGCMQIADESLHNGGTEDLKTQKEDYGGSEAPEFVALNFGYISAFYGIACATIAMYSKHLKATSTKMDILKLISNADEFNTTPIRQGERIGTVMLTSVPLKLLELLKSHMQRSPLTHDLQQDLANVLRNVSKHLYALVDVASSGGWLKTAMECMELMQRLVQAIGCQDSPLAQLPHFDKARISKCASAGVNDPFDLMALEDDDRDKLLKDLDEKATLEVATFCNAIQVLNITHSKSGDKSGEACQLELTIERDFVVEDAGANDLPAPAPYWPCVRKQQWWALVGYPQDNRLLGLKRFSLNAKQAVTRVKLDIETPSKPGAKLFVISDSIVGTDYQLDL